MSDFRDLLEYAQVQAMVHTLERTEVSVWRAICRAYSKNFNTPLHMCLDGSIPMEDILLAEMEEQLSKFDEEKDIENMLDQIYTIEDPTYESKKSVEVSDFIKKAEEDERERLRLGKPIHKAMKNEPTLLGDDQKNTSEKDTKPSKFPTSGGIDTSYFSRLESEEGSES